MRTRGLLITIRTELIHRTGSSRSTSPLLWSGLSCFFGQFVPDSSRRSFPNRPLPLVPLARHRPVIYLRMMIASIWTSQTPQPRQPQELSNDQLPPRLFHRNRTHLPQVQPAPIPVRLQKGKTESHSEICVLRDHPHPTREEVTQGEILTAIYGFDLDDAGLKKIASELKNRCGTGGSVKDGVIVIQRDHRGTVKDELTKQGYQVKLAGGWGQMPEMVPKIGGGRRKSLQRRKCVSMVPVTRLLQSALESVTKFKNMLNINDYS